MIAENWEEWEVCKRLPSRLKARSLDAIHIFLARNLLSAYPMDHENVLFIQFKNDLQGGGLWSRISVTGRNRVDIYRENVSDWIEELTHLIKIKTLTKKFRLLHFL